MFFPFNSGPRLPSSPHLSLGRRNSARLNRNLSVRNESRSSTMVLPYRPSWTQTRVLKSGSTFRESGYCIFSEKLSPRHPSLVPVDMTGKSSRGPDTFHGCSDRLVPPSSVFKVRVLDNSFVSSPLLLPSGLVTGSWKSYGSYVDRCNEYVHGHRARARLGL